MTTTTIAPDVPEQLQRELASLEFEKMALMPLPSIQAARDAVVDAQARHSVDASPRHLNQIQAAQRVLAERLQKHDRHGELTTTIARLAERLQAAESRIRIERATAADEALAAAKSEYQQAQIQCGRAFRRYLSAVKRSSNTPGASIANPDYRLHLPGITPYSWSGTTGEAMAQAMMPFEQQEG